MGLHPGGIVVKRVGARFVAVAIAMFVLVGVDGVHAQNAGSYVQLGFGARGIALGNAQVADVSGRAGVFYNPALAPMVTKQRLSGAVAALGLDREMQFLQFAAPIQPQAGVAAGVIYAGVSDIDGRDESGYHTEMLSSSEHGFFVAFGTRFTERVSAGAALTLYRARLGGEPFRAEGVAIDLGITYRLRPGLHLGFAASDLLARYDWQRIDPFGGRSQAGSDHFPTRLRGGASYHLRPGWQILAEAEMRLTRHVGESTSAHADVRFGVAHKPLEGLSLHAGIDRAVRWNASRPATGLGLDLPIGQLQASAEYTAVYESRIGGVAHVLALSLVL